MNEWIQTGIVGVIAYLSGILSKPLQDWISEKRELHKLKIAMYSEIANTLDFIALTINSLKRKEFGIEILDVFKDDIKEFICYKEAQKNPILLSRVKDIVGIRSFYGAITAFKEANNLTSLETLRLFLLTIKSMQTELIKKGKLKIRLLREYGGEGCNIFLDNIDNPNYLLPPNAPQINPSSLPKQKR
jgi:hypothetical protein